MGRVRVELVLLQLCAWAAASTVYVTDLPLYSSLAPCAAYAISYQIQGLTDAACPQAVTALASCACSKDNNAASVGSAIASSVLNYCSSTATEDVASAAAVFSRYCNQGSAAPSITPAPTLVSQYISDVGAFSNLAPCAQSGLSQAVFYLTDSLCPNGQSALQSCACTKNQNSLAASERVNSDVTGYCGSTASEDVASAQAIFEGYCGMGNGTTSFPAPGSISGTITYYITDLPAYKSLAPCATRAVSEVVQQLTESACQSAPNALASCACFKNQNSAGVAKLIQSSVSYECSSTASADVSSALGVFDFYCGAAGGKVVASGVTASVAQATGGSAPTTGGAKPAGTATTPGAAATGAGGSSGGSSGGGSSGGGSSSPSSTASGSSSNGALIGGIAGGVGAVALLGIGLIIWFCRRKRHQPTVLPSTAGSSPNQESKADVELHQYSKMPTPPLKPQDGVYGVPAVEGISEMPNHSVYGQAQSKYSAPSQYTKMSSPSMHTVSPVYEAGARPNIPEMGGQLDVAQVDGRPGIAQLDGRPGVAQLDGRPGIAQLDGRPGIAQLDGRPGIAQLDGRPGVTQLDGRPAASEMPGNNAGYYSPQQQPGYYSPHQQPNYPNQVYEMGQQQQQQQHPPPHQSQPHTNMSYNNAGPVYEMYSPDPR